MRFVWIERGNKVRGAVNYWVYDVATKTRERE